MKNCLTCVYRLFGMQNAATCDNCSVEVARIEREYAATITTVYHPIATAEQPASGEFIAPELVAEINAI